MAAPVEAQSLSTLTSLFATPPTYPRNPTHEVRGPLVLYIVRTPGSRDVFLTPLKPPTKASVSLEAIQSCLYYLHVITAEDDEIRSSLEEQRQAEDAERLAKTSPVHRKPLPATKFANYPALQRPPTPPKSYPHYQPGLNQQRDETQGARLAARGVHLRLNTRSQNNGGSLRRKPVGPRSIVTRSLDESSTLSKEPCGFGSEKVLKSFKFTAPSQEEKHQIHPTTDAVRTKNLEPWPQIEEEIPPALPPRTNLPCLAKKPVAQDVTRIVLIRRDPSSGSQWNVGTIMVANSGLSATVCIHTPGYQKFAKQDLRHHPLQSQDLQDETFTAAISPIGDHDKSPQFLRTIDILALRQPKLGRSAHQRNTSEDMYSPIEPNAVQSHNPPQSKCVFTSPWQGQCSFTTGLNGRSLKCRHSLPVASSIGESSSETACELRFNLPWLRIRRKSNQTQSDSENNFSRGSIPTSAEAKGVFRRSVQRLRSRSGSNMLSEDQRLQSTFENIKSRSNAADQQNRMDLSLGQEKAGGGFRGSSAKLGKLIIENEGLKFADLAVGACMSIWWTQYSSSGDEG